MAPYRQSCSSCLGRSATAYHDVERYERDLNLARAAERLARSRSQDSNLRHGSGNDGPPDDWEAEADYHSERARRFERLLAKSRARVLASFSVGGCVLCGGSGYLVATGTFVLGAKGAGE